MTTGTIPVRDRIAALEERRAHLEVHLQRCQPEAANTPALNASIGRELDDTRASLASVRAELARLESE